MRGVAVIAAAAMLIALPTSARAQDSSAENSDTIEYVRTIPLEAMSAIGGKHLGNLFYMTGTSWLSIYDVSDPLDPQQLSHLPLGYQWENEDVSTNGKILLVSETGIIGTPVTETLHVWDVSDPSAPEEIGRGLTMGDHTSECLYDCQWAYGSEGSLVDLRDPANPVMVGNWMTLAGFEGDAHDVEEVRPGLVTVSTISTPWVLMDVTDPLKPRIVAETEHPDPSWLFHSIHWPNLATDRWVLAQGEGNAAPIQTYRSVGTPEAPKFELTDSFSIGSESAHWFEHHPKFRDGGLLAAGWYGEGMRVLEVSQEGKITEVGFWKPNGAIPTQSPSTWGAYWIGDTVIYSVDNSRGLDVLKWKGPIPVPPVTAPPTPPPSGGFGPGEPHAGVGAAVELNRIAGLFRKLGLRKMTRRSLGLKKGAMLTVRSGGRVLARGAKRLRLTAAGRKALRRKKLRVELQLRYGRDEARKRLTIKR